MHDHWYTRLVTRLGIHIWKEIDTLSSLRHHCAICGAERKVLIAKNGKAEWVTTVEPWPCLHDYIDHQTYDQNGYRFTMGTCKNCGQYELTSVRSLPDGYERAERLHESESLPDVSPSGRITTAIYPHLYTSRNGGS